jgi:hypothetical protein
MLRVLLPRRGLLLAGALLLLGPGAAPAQEEYYLLMFASQRTPPEPEHSHSFATFVRVSHNGPQPGVPVIEVHTISWLPANLRIRLFALKPEPGYNFDLHTTLRDVLADCQRVSLWGPYQINPDLYCRALKQINLLNSGQVQYKAVDTGHFSDRVSNCIHAVSSIVEGYRVCVFSPGWGETASFAILQRFAPWILDCNHMHDWLVRALHLECYPIIYRDYEHPRSGLLRGPVSRVFGTQPGATPSYGPPR